MASLFHYLPLFPFGTQERDPPAKGIEMLNQAAHVPAKFRLNGSGQQRE